MAHEIPFNGEIYRVQCIPGNDKADKPVEFELSQVGGADLARLKTLLYALSGLAFVQDWTPELQKNVIEAFKNGPTVFVEGIDGISNLTVPARMAVKAGILAELPDGVKRSDPIPIINGDHFAKIAPFQTVLALEIAMRLANISEEGELDLRFFGSPSTSRAKPTKRRGTSGRSGAVTSARKR